jgi:O-antigen ligase
MVTAHPNTVGAFFALVAPVLLGAIDDDRARRMAPLYAFCAFLGAVLTFSRLSLAGLFVGSAMIFLATWLRRHPVRFGAIGAVAVFVAAGTIGYLSLGRSEADWQRLRIIHASLTLFAENWMTGVGFGTEYLERVFPDRYAELYGTRVWLYHSHNMYVDLLTETGVLGALAAGWLLVRLAMLGRRALVASGENPGLRRVGSGFAATVAVFFLIGIGDMPWYDERLVFPLAIVWGLMEGWTCSVEEGRRSAARRA